MLECSVKCSVFSHQLLVGPAPRNWILFLHLDIYSPLYSSPDTRVQGEERIVGVHAPRRAQGVCGETRRRSLFRTTKIRFYPTIFSTFCFLAELGAQKGPKWALRGHQPIDFRPFRTPSRDRRFFAKWTLFAHRSLLLHYTSRETDGGTTDRVIDAFAPFEGLALRYIEDDRSSCSIGVLAAFDGL